MRNYRQLRVAHWNQGARSAARAAYNQETTPVPILPLSSLKAGMILARDALDASGEVVFPEGTILDQSVLSRLRKAEVEKAAVKGRTSMRRRATRIGARPAPAPEPEVRADADAETEERLKRLAIMFSSHRDDPLMREVLRIAILCAREGLVHG